VRPPMCIGTASDESTANEGDVPPGPTGSETEVTGTLEPTAGATEDASADPTAEAAEVDIGEPTAAGEDDGARRSAEGWLIDEDGIPYDEPGVQPMLTQFHPWAGRVWTIVKFPAPDEEAIRVALRKWGGRKLRNAGVFDCELDCTHHVVYTAEMSRALDQVVEHRVTTREESELGSDGRTPVKDDTWRYGHANEVMASPTPGRPVENLWVVKKNSERERTCKKCQGCCWKWLANERESLGRQRRAGSASWCRSRLWIVIPTLIERCRNRVAPGPAGGLSNRAHPGYTQGPHELPSRVGRPVGCITLARMAEYDGARET